MEMLPILLLIMLVSPIIGFGVGYLIVRVLGTEDSHIDARTKIFDKGEY